MSRYNIISIAFFVLFLGSLALDGSFNIPLVWYIMLIIVFAVINIFGSIFLWAQYYFPVKLKAKPDTNKIAITFDDGPIPGKTERILDILQHYNIKATFFCIGYHAKQHSMIIKRMNGEGHLIGNHSFTHSPLFDFKSSTMISKELAETETVVQQAIGRKPRFFRPPFGLSQPMIAQAIRKRNYTVIGWSLNAKDLRIKDEEKLLKRITQSLKGGDIVRFHDRSEIMISVLPLFLEHVKKSGMEVVSLDELVNEKAYEVARKS